MPRKKSSKQIPATLEDIERLESRFNLLDKSVPIVIDNKILDMGLAVERLYTKVERLAYRIDALEENRTIPEKEKIDEKIKNINLSIGQLLGRFQLMNLKLEDFKKKL
jgi:hypothetical protein